MLLSFCTHEKLLFNSLLDKGYDSPWICLFAEQERYCHEFKDPDFKEILWTKTTRLNTLRETQRHLQNNRTYETIKFTV